MATNEIGFKSEVMIRALLPDIGIPHKHRTNGNTWFLWASWFEDHELGFDCWLSLCECGVVAVDFTVLAPGSLFNAKLKKCMAEGVVMVSLDYNTVSSAYHRTRMRALEELNREIRLQVALRLPLLNGNRMTMPKAKAARLAAARR